MNHEDGCPPTRVKLVASTGDITAATTAQNGTSGAAASALEDGGGGGGDIRGYFETAQWTADGTTLLTSSSSNLISGYVVPSDLLSPRAAPHALGPTACIPLPEPSSVLAGAPYFSLAEPWTNQLLVSSRDHPIQLFYLAPPASSSSLAPAAAASSYPLTKSRSETFLTATSLAWPAPGTHFVAGARSLLTKYDVSRTGDEPLARIKTIPSERHLAKGGGVGMRGTVSALGAQPLSSSASGGGGSLLAAGTWTRWVGLYDFNAPAGGECVATWSIASAAAGVGQGEWGAGKGNGIGGDGVTQTVWSPCGRYLLIGERKSRGVLVYDVRVTGQLLGWLAGREALGNQRIGFDVFPGQEGESSGFEVWSGTSGGAVKVWEGVGGREGPHEPSWAWEAHRQSTVESTCVHPSGTVIATCSGSWEFPDEDEDGDDKEQVGSGDSGGLSWMRRRNKESSLKIWSISGDQDDEDTGLQEGKTDELE
ncbi:hypothetical protein F5X99DRAFT_300671 [Biscogniauxia marginata]|nr:hypothetical protein F5X99DRAFT_300671 [Biscogniauxia marginata]